MNVDGGSIGSDLSSTQSNAGRHDWPLFILGLADAPESREPDEPKSKDDLEEAAEDEHEYLRNRLREELKREPTEEEMDEWLRRHTQSY
jgi:hypothetical protein